MKIPSLHHFIFATFPVTFLFLENINEIPLDDLFLPLIISTSLLIIPWLIMVKFIGNEKSSLITSLFVILLISFSFLRSYFIYNEIILLRGIASNYILIPLFTSIGIIIVISIWKKNTPSSINQTFNLMGFLIIGFFIFQIILDSSNENSFEIAQQLLDVPTYQINNEIKLPNVYFILLDAYSGEITLEQDYDYNNNEFYDKLTDRGFVVQKNSMSNYPNTELSMPSIMNMNYLDFLVDLQGTNSNDMSVTQKLWNDNRVMDFFKKNSYEIYSFEGRSGNRILVDENFCSLPFDINRELAQEIITNYIPISFIRENLRTELHYVTVVCVLNTAENNWEKTTPYYVHLHVRFPHQPFIFDKDGNRIIDSTSLMARFDEKLKNSYLEQLIYSNSRTIQIIDTIQKEDPSTIIILMSDHGGRFGINWNDPSDLDYLRGFNNLLAVYFPGKENQIPQQISSVNVFRTFFNIYFNTDYAYLEDRQIWYSPSKPFLQKDVTEKIQLYLSNQN